jgi:Zn-dependent peptidase ImmA (M78 family)
LAPLKERKKKQERQTNPIAANLLVSLPFFNQDLLVYVSLPPIALLLSSFTTSQVSCQEFSRVQQLMDGSKRAAKNLQTSAERKATEHSNEEGKGEGKNICVVYTLVESGEQKTEREENSLKVCLLCLLAMLRGYAWERMSVHLWDS